MTETQWVSGTDPRAMLDHLAGLARPRQYSILCVRMGDQIRRARPELEPQWEAAECLVEGLADVSEVRRVWTRDPRQPGPCWPEMPAAWAVGLVHRQLTERGAPFFGQPGPLADLVREIFGNPFRRVRFDRRWHTHDVQTLARFIHEEQAFDRLPLLADALMDAGCDDETVLDHCKSDGPHVRGCWVVDLVLDQD